MLVQNEDVPKNLKEVPESDLYMICENKEIEEMDTDIEKISELQPDTVAATDASALSGTRGNGILQSSNSSFLRQILTGQGYRNDFLAMGEIMKVQQLMNTSLNSCISMHHNGFSALSAWDPSQEQITDSRYTIQQLEKFKKVRYRHSVDVWSGFDRFGE